MAAPADVAILDIELLVGTRRLRIDPVWIGNDPEWPDASRLTGEILVNLRAVPLRRHIVPRRMVAVLVADASGRGGGIVGVIAEKTAILLQLGQTARSIDGENVVFSGHFGTLRQRFCFFPVAVLTHVRPPISYKPTNSIPFLCFFFLLLLLLLLFLHVLFLLLFSSCFYFHFPFRTLIEENQVGWIQTIQSINSKATSYILAARHLSQW